MCFLCRDLDLGILKPYDVQILAREHINSIGHDHYKQIIDFLKLLEERKKKAHTEEVTDPWKNKRKVFAEEPKRVIDPEDVADYHDYLNFFMED